MKVKILASGSKGNATVIETVNNIILIDIGLSYKKLKEKLALVDLDVNDINAIFITHEHSDHIKGLETFIKRHNVDVYMSKGTYRAIVAHKKIGLTYEHYNIIEVDDEVQLLNDKVIPFYVSHDANEPFGYVIYEDHKKLVYLTDTGFVSEENEKKIKNADIYILESNHNIELLMSTNRPWNLKQRILGDLGHLCNEDALMVLNRVKGENTKYVYLAHLSEEANNHDLLSLTVERFQWTNTHYAKFFIAFQHQISEIVEI